MKPTLTFILLLFISIAANSQTQSATLDANNTSIDILNGGDFFTDRTSGRYIVPKVESSQVKRSTIYSGAIWIGGLDENDSIHVAAMTYRQAGQDFYSGPSSDSHYVSQKNYDRIYVVDLDEIDQHKKDPSKASGPILDWPGNGDTTIGEPWQLAPFVDLNKNGKYEPKLGDHPKIKGYKAAYCIYNDNWLHTETNGKPFNFDIHQLFYQESKGTKGGLFDETNLAYFKIVNRSNTTYHDIKFGLFVDFDLGAYDDDYIGCDSSMKMGYVYNGKPNDDGVTGYGINPPSQNVMFLNKNLHAVAYYNNNFDTVSGNPRSPQHFYNLLDGNLTNGSSLKSFYGAKATNSRFVYHGNPADTTEWSETSDKNRPGDRRLLVVAEPFVLSPNDMACIDVAFVYGRAASGGPIASFKVMKDVASEVQNAYVNDFNNWSSYTCDGIVTSTRNFKKESFVIYPNPSSGLFKIEGYKDGFEGHIFNTTGAQLDVKIGNDGIIDLSNYPSGMYFFRNKFGSQRLIKL